MRIGIDLLWVREGICGGTESYIRNLLDGFAAYGMGHEYVLFAAKDHARSFLKYTQAAHMHLQVCRVKSANRVKRILWENRYLDAAAARRCIDVMLVPVYSKPAARVSSIPYVSVIHDFQALHYPEYFSPVKRYFLQYSWKRTMRTSAGLVTISEDVKKDLAWYFPSAKAKAVTIYNPVVTKRSGIPAEVIERRYGIRRMEYFYCVSSMLPHKNLDTVLSVIQGMAGACLVISGVGKEKDLQRKLHACRMEEKVVLTGFVPGKVRDCLYENCRLFLFPSVFEGFGMPPVEAMRRGKRVVMTRCASLEEVTQGRAVYVEDPYSVAEWKEKIRYALALPEEKIPFPEYELREIIRQYTSLFSRLARKKERKENGRRQAKQASQLQIYEQIYDIVSENYQKAGKQLDYEKRAFLCSIGAHPRVVDVSGCTGLSNAEFYQAVHTAVYHRLPEREEYEKWSAFFGMEPSAFQRKLLKKLSASSVAAVNRIRLVRHPYFCQHTGVWYRALGVLYGLTDKPTLRQIGKKLPVAVQKIARKVFL
ncbi:MAG: glycosyltransferase family 4 protein [Eubacterium sp.]|nr:glycosyltransferase family 4 protein [Eubacterium sp.]